MTTRILHVTSLDRSIGTIHVADCAIRFQRFGRRGVDPLLLVHGTGAHAGWWRYVAPDLASSHDVVLVELSGHGDSDHRASYTPELWAREIAAVVGDVDIPAMSIVGHSMGGLAAIYAAARCPGGVSNLVLVDTPLGKVVKRVSPVPGAKIYPTLGDALDDFRLRPRGSTADPEMLEAVARAGLCEVSGGWRWKFDPNTTQRFTNEGLADALSRVRCPVGLIYGQHSALADSTTADLAAAHLGRPVPRLEVSHAFHHVPLDAPHELSAGIERILRTLRTGQR
jgi:pimeloyl-ACP methyl ester carboxylesterase